RKMERTRDNLLRVQDILREVERQLATLRRQARRAEQYKALLAEITVLDMSLSARTRVRLLGEIADICAQREQPTDRESVPGTTVDRVDGERRDAREHEVAAQQAVQDAQAAAYDARAAADACRNELARLQGRATELEAQDRAVADDLAHAAEQRRSIAAER